MELPLEDSEFNARLVVLIPVVTRTTCPDCHGTDVNCLACDGRGSYKKTRQIRLRVDGGLSAGQVLSLDLKRIKLGELSHFRKSILRIKIINIKKGKTQPA